VKIAMLKKILIGIAAVVAILLVGFFIAVSMQPNEFRISRSAKMNAPPAAVFAQLSDFHNWDAWSPWAKLDPNAKATFEGPTSGTGATFIWSGNDKVGAGRQTIIESRPDELIRIKLEFEKPFRGASTAEFTLKPQSDQTLVTWSMFGTNNFMGKVMSLLMDCDKMVGSEFEKGLANMKAIVESPADKSEEGKSASDAAVTKTE
jgi:uncharacterized protein YndB with AHSA1/START domain